MKAYIDNVFWDDRKKVCNKRRRIERTDDLRTSSATTLMSQTIEIENVNSKMKFDICAFKIAKFDHLVIRLCLILLVVR